MIARHYALLCALLLAAHITGCASHRPAPDERATASLVPGPMRLDTAGNTTQPAPTLEQIPQKPGVLARIFGRKASESRFTAGGKYHANTTQIPRKCKGCQFTTVIGNDNKVSQASIGKSKATAVVNSDSATVQVATNAVAGRGNTATQTATETKPGFPWGRVALALGGVGLLVLLLATPVVPWLLAAFKRKNNANQA